MIASNICVKDMSRPNFPSLIIERRLCYNFCSTILIDKLILTIIPHPKPYKLHWLNEDGEINVNNQVKVTFFWQIQWYYFMWCSAMEACNVLLGGSWQFNKKMVLLMRLLLPIKIKVLYYILWHHHKQWRTEYTWKKSRKWKK